MNVKLSRLSERYLAALRKHLKRGPKVSLQPAQDWGCQAAALDLEALDVARIHEGALATLEAASSRDGIVQRAASFFAEAITPIEETHRAALRANVRLSKLTRTLDRRTMALAASKQFLKQGITQRQAVEKALRQSGCGSAAERGTSLRGSAAP